jgi:hypothetical protein
LLLIYLIASCPIVTAQAFTYYVDGPLYLLSIIFLAQMLLAKQYGGLSYYLSALAAGVLLINAKLSGPYFFGLIMAMFCVYAIKGKSDLRRWVIFAATTSIIAVFIVGFHPFVLKVKEEGAPEYIKKSISKGGGPDVPANLRGIPGPLQLAYSVFSETENRMAVAAELKLPFTMSFKELYWMAVPGARIGGFGPFFSGILLVSAGLFLVAVAKSWRGDGKGGINSSFLLAVLIAFVTAILFPEPWRARFIALFWAIPFFLLAAAEPMIRKNRAMTFIFVSILTISVLNTGLAFTGNIARTVVQNWKFYSFITRLEAGKDRVFIVEREFNTNFDLTLHHRLALHGIDAVIQKDYRCKKTLYTYHQIARVCR